jgi:hypothetical protein
MASEKQIAANRANAKKSTGPKTAVGKLKSSQNAYRHGLSSPLRLDSAATSAKAASLVRVLVGEGANEIRLKSAKEFAHAQLELERIRKTQEELTATFYVDQAEVRTLRRMASLDRYERYALTKRRQALRKL